MIELSNIVEIKHYEPTEFPAKNLFLNNYYAVTNSYCFFKKEPLCNRKELVYKHALEVFDKCKVAALVDNTNENFVLAYVLYDNEETTPVLYFAYTKRSFRNNKLFKTLLLSAGFDWDYMIKCKYIGRIPYFLRPKILKERV